MNARPAGEVLINFNASIQNAVEQSSITHELEFKTIEECKIDDLQAMVDAARQEGKMAGFEEGLTQGRSLLSEEQKKHVQELVEAKKTWIKEFAEPLKEQLQLATFQMQNELSKNIEGILKPFITSKILENAISELKDILSHLYEDGDDVKPILMSGPKDILDMLAKDLSSTFRQIKLEPAEKADVKIIFGKTHIETQLQAWISCLQETSEL